MICILGYSANASAIALEVAIGNEEEMGTEHLAVQAATAFWLVIKLTRGEWVWVWVQSLVQWAWVRGRRWWDAWADVGAMISGRRCTFAQDLVSRCCMRSSASRSFGDSQRRNKPCTRAVRSVQRGILSSTC